MSGPPDRRPDGAAEDLPPGSAASLARWHLTPEDVGGADTSGELALVAIARAFGGRGRRYDIDELAEVIGADPVHLRLLWRSLGFTEPITGEKLLSDSDLRMLAGIIPFLSEGGLSDELALQMTRVIGSSMARIATAQVDSVVAQFDADGANRAEGEGTLEFESADQAMAAQTASLLSAMPDVLEFVWRRHLVNAAQRRLLRRAGAETALCVGFADLVGFTAHTQQLNDRELAAVVERFEKLAYDVIPAQGGRVVKMIGDEVLFVADDIPTGARIALAIAEAYRHDEALSDVRVGLAAGSVLEREGDVYGPVVNLANRIVVVAFPGSVVVSSEVAGVLADDPSLSLRRIRSQPLKDIGTVPLWTLRPATSPDHPARTRTARQHLRNHWEDVADRRVERQRRAVQLSHEIAGEGVGDEVAELLGGLGPGSFVDEPTDQIEAIAEAVLAADIEPELQVGLLADIDAVRRLHQLEDQAADAVEEVDAEAQDRILEVEADARRRVERIEIEASRRVQEVLAEAERRVSRVQQSADRKVRRMAEEVTRDADRVERESLRRARFMWVRNAVRRRRR